MVAAIKQLETDCLSKVNSKTLLIQMRMIAKERGELEPSLRVNGIRLLLQKRGLSIKVLDGHTHIANVTIDGISMRPLEKRDPRRASQAALRRLALPCTCSFAS